MLWLIEPHADDVFLSLHGHITTLWKDKPKTIVTVFGNPKRIAESAAYAHAVKCQHRALGFSESGRINHEAALLPVFEDWGLNVEPGDNLVFPLGLQHPEHRAVSQRSTQDCRTYYYMECPYYAKQKLGTEVNELVQGMAMSSFLWVSKTKWNYIKYFKSQAKFFYYNPPASLPRIEIILE